MIHFIIGPKGSGKTKKVIEMANRAIEETKGNVVFIDGDYRKITGLKYRVRFINAREFDLKDLSVLYGFLCGIIARDYDIEHVYIDGIIEDLGGDVKSIEDFVMNVKKLSDKFNIQFVITMSGTPESVPVFLKEYMLEEECIA